MFQFKKTKQKVLAAGSAALVALGVTSVTLQMQQSPLPEGLFNLDHLTAQAGRDNHVYNPSQSKQGVLIYASDNNTIRCSSSPSDRSAVLGDILALDTTTRFWMYEFNGKEPGEFTGDFYISEGEINAQTGQTRNRFRALSTLTEFKPGKRYFIMTAEDLIFQCGVGLEAIYECGNNVVEPDQDYNHLNINHVAEECDGSSDCSDDCEILPAVCGNGLIEGDEECDDGNTTEDDGCSNNCVAEDGFACEGEPSVCEPIIPDLPGDPVCGDGTVEDDEQCDDGNTNDGDGCTSECRTEVSCNDSDGGNDSSVLGTVSAGPYSTQDTCSSAYQLEWLCNTDQDTPMHHSAGSMQFDGTGTLGDMIFEHFGHRLTVVSSTASSVTFDWLNTEYVVDLDEEKELGDSGFVVTLNSIGSNSVSIRTKHHYYGAVNNTCDDGSSCSAGICSDPNACTDTDGDDKYTRGTLRGPGGGGGIYTMTDTCFENDTKVIEGRCINGQTNVTNYVCENGCSEGACIRNDEVQLHSAELLNNGASVKITYSKNFATCAHIYRGSGKFDHRINFICGQGDNLEANANQDQFNDTLFVGDEIKICHGNNGNICSDIVTITDGDSTGGGNSLTIAVKQLNTVDTAVENQNNVNLLRFEAQGGDVDTLLTKTEFTSSELNPPHIQNALQNMQNYTLKVDTDGNGSVDTVLEDGVSASQGLVTFNDLQGGGYVVPDGQSVIFEVHADVASSLNDEESLQLRFATDEADYVAAEVLSDGTDLQGIRTNGGCPAPGTCEILVDTVPSTTWILVEQGDLFVSLDSTPVRSRQLLGGAVGEPILRLTLHAENEDIDVTDLQISSVASQAVSVDRLELYFDGSATPFAIATIGGCGTDNVPTTDPAGNPTQTFCANMESRQLIIPEGDDVDVLVRPNMKRDTVGGRSGENIQFFIHRHAAADEATGEGAVRARGDTSANDLLANNGDSSADGEVFIGSDSPSANAHIIGQPNTAVMAKISDITNANPDPNGSGVPVGLTPFGQFKFTAANHNNSKDGLNDVVLDRILFTVNATNVAMEANFQLYNKADSTVTTNCDVLYENGSPFTSDSFAGTVLVACYDLGFSSVNTEIDRNSDQTFVLQGNVMNPSVNPSATSTLQAAITNFSNYAEVADYNPLDHRIVWIDRDGCDINCETGFIWVEHPETVVNSTSYQS